jgi:hypothetical protein
MTYLFSRWTIILLGSAAVAGWAQPSQEIYVSTGEHGETTFSDVAGPSAERVEVATSEPAENSLAELERRIQQTLTVANALEESRLAREKARAEARAAAAAQAQPEPQVVYQDRYVNYPYVLRSPYDRRFHGDRRGRHKDVGHPRGRRDRPDRIPEETSSRAFIYDPD